MNSKHYKDLYAFHPGYYVNQLIDELEITQKEVEKNYEKILESMKKWK